MMKKEGGVIEVYLGESSAAGNGPLARFGKVDGKWVRIDQGEIGIWQE